MLSRHSAIVPLWILDGSDGDLAVEFDFIPGGLANDEDKLEIRSAHYAGVTIPVLLAEHEEQRVIDWLADEWEQPDNESPGSGEAVNVSPVNK